MTTLLHTIEGPNPLLPAGYDLLWSGVLLLLLALTVLLLVVALRSLLRDETRTVATKTVWAAGFVIAPILGPGLWLLRTDTQRTPSRAPRAKR